MAQFNVTFMQDEDPNVIFYEPSVPNVVFENVIASSSGITAIAMNGEIVGTSGVVDLGTVITEHQSLDGKQDLITNSNKIPYSLISGTPAIPSVPTNVSAFVNDSGYLTQHQDISGKQDRITEDNKLDYSLINNTPTIPSVPTNVSSFRNDAGYLTAHQDISGKADKATTLAGYGITDASIDETSRVITIGTHSITVPTSGGGGSSIEGIKMNGSVVGTSGIVDLGTVITEHQDISGKQDKITSTNKLSYNLISGTPTIPTVPSNVSAFTNDAGYLAEHQSLEGKQDKITTSNKLPYSLLSGTPTIPSEVTESTVSGWGFTKSTGTYSKPSGGIPKTDLASAVQTSLGKADTALQSFTETDPTVPSWAKESTKPSYSASEVGALPISGGTLTGALKLNSANYGTSLPSSGEEGQIFFLIV